jgi:hypothetical protein
MCNDFFPSFASFSTASAAVTETAILILDGSLFRNTSMVPNNEGKTEGFPLPFLHCSDQSYSITSSLSTEKTPGAFQAILAASSF